MFRRMFRWSIVGVLGVAALVSIVGLTRVKTAWWSVRDHLRSNVDQIVDTRVALQHEIKKLQREYPRRITDLRVNLTEIERDLGECEGDLVVAREALTIAESDLAVLSTKLTALDSDADGVGSDGLEFRAERLGRHEAVSRAGRISEDAAELQSRVTDLETERQLLAEERTRLRGEIAGLVREQREFEAEVGTMLREIDSLKRKEKLVEVAERRQGDGEDLFSDHASGLAVVKEKIERRKIELEERLRSIRAVHGENEYEARARVRLATRGND